MYLLRLKPLRNIIKGINKVNKKNQKKLFAQQLYTTIIPSNMSQDELINKLDTLQNAANNCLSKSLFRFRACTERSISAFYNDELWVSTSDCMNDGFDTRIYINQKELESIICNIVPKHINKEFFLQKLESLSY